tara:strand:+ start:3396 stop:3683 length:288 start_codon:yes stop_codon:yes gene_type:complete
MIPRYRLTIEIDSSYMPRDRLSEGQTTAYVSVFTKKDLARQMTVFRLKGTELFSAYDVVEGALNNLLWRLTELEGKVAALEGSGGTATREEGQED